jgi:hypothetical protein
MAVTEFEFTAWPKTTRLYRDITVTEKIDGTNAAIHFDGEGNVAAQSRKRLITPENDNFGFARWAHENREDLFEALGPGTHFGEWWGKGIQRGYGLDHRRFSLFNTAKWLQGPHVFEDGTWLDSVPVLHRHTFSEVLIRIALHGLQSRGSVAAPGFMNPEGVCIFHSQTRLVQKVTLDNEDRGKWELEAA